jgi:hypothetical protein
MSRKISSTDSDRFSDSHLRKATASRSLRLARLKKIPDNRVPHQPAPHAKHRYAQAYSLPCPILRPWDPTYSADSAPRPQQSSHGRGKAYLARRGSVTEKATNSGLAVDNDDCGLAATGLPIQSARAAATSARQTVAGDGAGFFDLGA